MLTDNQQKYIQTIPQDKTTSIQPFNPKAKETGEKIAREITENFPELEVHFGGSTALEIAGQNDIDLNILSVSEEYGKYLPGLKNLFGEPAKSTPSLIEWNFKKNNFEIELYLTDKNSPLLLKQIKTFELMRDNLDYQKEYEQIKLSCNGLPFREYMKRKYEFFNKILNLN